MRFAPNWSNPKHEEFWTLAMAWKVDTKTEIALDDIKFNFYHYFDALMKPNHWAQEFPSPQLMFTDLEVAKSGQRFKGKMSFFDGFHTGKVITVNILGNQVFCKASGTSIIIFRLSPKAFDAPIWEDLNAIVVNSDRCEH